MLTGNVSKLVNDFGSAWGHVRPERRAEVSKSQDVFFNIASMLNPYDFLRLHKGSAVRFNVQRDRAKGIRALNMSIVQGSDAIPKVEAPADGALT